MSIKQLTDDEKATYLIGLAVRRHFEKTPQNPKTRQEFKAVFGWMQRRLTDRQTAHIFDNTDWGWTEHVVAEKGFRSVVVGPGRAKGSPPSRPARRPKPDKPDDIPF
jgi:hypothetical protein